MRLAVTVNWQTISFLLESGVFLLMGLQLRALLDQVEQGTRACRARPASGC